MVVPRNEYGDNTADAALFAQRIAVESLVPTHALRSAPSAADRDAINCFDNQSLIMIVCFADGVGDGMPAGFTDHRPLNARNPVFS